MPNNWIAVYQQQSGEGRTREVRFASPGEDPDREQLEKDAKKNEKLVGVYHNNAADAGLQNADGTPKQFGPKV